MASCIADFVLSCFCNCVCDILCYQCLRRGIKNTQGNKNAQQASSDPSNYNPPAYSGNNYGYSPMQNEQNAFNNQQNNVYSNPLMQNQQYSNNYPQPNQFGNNYYQQNQQQEPLATTNPDEAFQYQKTEQNA
jgi:hypothetical protein